MWSGTVDACRICSFIAWNGCYFKTWLVCEVDDKNNILSLGCEAHWIRVKVETVRIMSRILFGIHVGFAPNGSLGSGSLSGVGYH